MKCFVLVRLLFSIPFGLLFSNWPSLLSSVLLCVVPASALSLSPRKRFDVSPLCRRPPVPWLVDSRRGWRGNVGVDRGWKRAGQRGGTCTQSLACVSASSSTASLDRRLNSCVSDHHTVAVTSLSLSLNLFPFSLPPYPPLFFRSPFVCLSINVLWESSRWQVNLFFFSPCVCSIRQNMKQMKFPLYNQSRGTHSHFRKTPRYNFNAQSRGW